jgi:hypothetical protein
VPLLLIYDPPVEDVRPDLTAQRSRLLELLESLDDNQWHLATAAPAWSVKDIVLHLLDVDLSWLAQARDLDSSGIIPVPDDHAGFVQALADRHQAWVDGTHVLSPRLITDLLRWSGDALDTYLASVDLDEASSVYWAGNAPLWFDLAREFTERWVHFRQIRQAVRPLETAKDEYLPIVIRTFMWGYPHQYNADAPSGTTVDIHIDDIGAWTLTRGKDNWSLDEGPSERPAATLSMPGESAWRLLTNADYDSKTIDLSGDEELGCPLLLVRGIIV